MPPLSWPDDALRPLALCLAVEWAIIVTFLAVVRSASKFHRSIAVVAVVGLAACPTLVPLEDSGTRAIAVLVCFDAIFRVIDVDRRTSEARTTSFRNDLRFFVPFPILLVTAEEWTAARRCTMTIRTAAARTAIGLVLFIAAWAILFALQKSSTHQSSFVLDHIVKTSLFAVTLEIIGLLASGLERLAGFETEPLMRRILLSRTPAEFWWRYNTRIHAWLVRNVFRRIGGASDPVRSISLVFLVSAVFHEAAFDIALGHIDGCQFAFFLLQIPAVLAWPALVRFAKQAGVAGRLISHAVTIAWFLTTSVLFVRGLGQIFPFIYTAPMPGAPFGEWRF